VAQLTCGHAAEPAAKVPKRAGTGAMPEKLGDQELMQTELGAVQPTHLVRPDLIPIAAKPRVHDLARHPTWAATAVTDSPASTGSTAR